MILYTDHEPFVCDVLRARVADGGLLPGDVWERDVRTLTADELKPYTQVHLFCGIGASPLGLKWAGWPAELSVVTGGFPCQDISVAGKGAGIDGARSGLWKEMHRVIDIVRPRWVIAENVPALRTRGIDRVLGDMERIGYQCWPLVVGADDVGAPHRRKRVWIVCRMADTDDATSSAELVSVCAGGEEAELAGSGGVPDAASIGGRCRSDHANAPQSGGCGIELADAPRGGLRADGIARGDAGHADECGACGFQFDHATLGKYGCPNCNGEGLGDTEPTRLEGHRPDTGQSQLAQSRYASPRRWPVGPGQAQHEWEAPRLTFGEVGDPASRLPGRLARTWNRHALKALGNAQVPQVVELIARAIVSERSKA